jgi:hypothetical protein
MFYVWLGLIAAGWLKPLWRWIQRNRAKSWPLTTGQIVSATVDESKPFFVSTPRRGSTVYVAELGYSYSVVGHTEASFYKREFNTEEEAWEFLRDLKGKPIAVHYNPNKPATSTLSEQSVETLLQTRAPRPAGEMFLSGSANSIPLLLSRFLWLFVVLSAVGLVVSLWVHFGAVMGRRVAPEPFFWILHVGIFVVWFPTVWVAQKRVGNLQRKDFWKVVLNGSPEWMRYMVYGFGGYAIINFALFMLKAPYGSSGNNPSTTEWRGFSGHWMAFYSAALAILYSAVRANETGSRCVNGHPVLANAAFCTQCGQAVMHR